MSEFHRMITYLYLYEDNHKTRNTGYAKIEKRDNRCLIEIHMKSTGYSVSSVPVYFYTQRNNSFPGILLGELSLSHGNGDFKETFDSSSLADSGLPLSDVKGIYIPVSDSIMLVSQWDNDDFIRGRFLVYSPHTNDTSHRAPVAHRNAAPNRSSAPQRNGVPNRSSAPQRDVNPNSPSAPQRDVSPSSPSASQGSFTPNKDSAPCQDTADLTAAEAAPELNQSPFSSKGFQEENSSESEHWDLKWQFIQENFPVVTPFEGDESTICVRVELKDLKLLPKNYWILGNNSFLLHGFFNYHYLILGMTTVEEKKRWFIGIPGVFQNPEGVMAAVFGFPEFRCEKLTENKTGEFGLWYRYMEE